MTEEEDDVAEIERRTRDLRASYDTDTDAFSALSLIVTRLARQVPWHVRRAFDWFNED